MVAMNWGTEDTSSKHGTVIEKRNATFFKVAFDQSQLHGHITLVVKIQLPYSMHKCCELSTSYIGEIVKTEFLQELGSLHFFWKKVYFSETASIHHFYNAPGNNIVKTLCQGQWPRCTRENGHIKVAFLYEKSVHSKQKLGLSWSNGY